MINHSKLGSSIRWLIRIQCALRHSLELSDHTCFWNFFCNFKTSSFSLVVRPLPPPHLSGRTTKKRTFFAASLTLTNNSGLFFKKGILREPILINHVIKEPWCLVTNRDPTVEKGGAEMDPCRLDVLIRIMVAVQVWGSVSS